MLKNILLLSDTHGYIDEKIISHTNYVDEVWHAGDIGNTRVIDSIKLLKPIKAVYGNIDSNEIRMMTEKNLIFESEGVRVVMTHIAGYPGRYNRSAIELIQKYNPNLFICGHSHILKVIQEKNITTCTLIQVQQGLWFHKKNNVKI